MKGLETNKFNNFLSQSIYQSNSNIDVQLDTIKFKLDIKEISLFLNTKNQKLFIETSISSRKYESLC